MDEEEVEMIIGTTKLVDIDSIVMRSSETIETSLPSGTNSNDFDHSKTIKHVERTIDIKNDQKSNWMRN